MKQPKYIFVPKEEMRLPKQFLLAVLAEWHDQFYGAGDIPGSGSEYDKGVAEGFKRMIRFIEGVEVEPL